MSRPPTTREIALACACSQSTVSNALRDDPRISEETRRRVQTMARDLGWRPNPLASAYMAHLRASRRRTYRATLAFTVSNPASPRIEDLPCFQRLNFSGARERAEALGYRLQPVWLHEPGLNARNLTRLLKNRGIPGLIVPSFVSAESERLLTAIDWSPFACVALGHALASLPVHRTTFNYARAVPMALHSLFGLGYRRIAVVLSDTYDRKVNHGWLYPLYYEERRTWKRKWVKSCVVPGTGAGDREQVREWILKHRPEVVLGEYLAWHVINDLGWTIPDDIAFASFDWSPDHTEIGGILQNHDIIGAHAVDLIATQIVHNERGLSEVPRHLQIEGRWRPGPSVPARARDMLAAEA